MVTIAQFYNLEQRVSTLETRLTSSSSLKVYDPIKLLLESSRENVKSVDPASVLKYLNQADIFVKIHVHNVKTVEASCTITQASSYYHYFIVEPNFTVFVISKKYMVYENYTLYLDNDNMAGLYFTDSQVIPKLDGVFFLVNSQQQNVSAQLIKKAVGGVAVDVYKSNKSIINIDVKIIGDSPSTNAPEENFGLGHSQTRPKKEHFDGGGD